MGPFTDDFAREDGPLGANWTDITTDVFAIESNLVKGTSAAALTVASWAADVLPEEHYSQVAMPVTWMSLGPAVRCQAGPSAYMLCIADGSTCQLILLLNGNTFTLQEIPIVVAHDDVLRLSINGGLLRCYFNNIQRGTDVVDQTLTGGAPGIIGFTDQGRVHLFECGGWGSISVDQDQMSFGQRQG